MWRGLDSGGGIHMVFFVCVRSKRLVVDEWRMDVKSDSGKVQATPQNALKEGRDKWKAPWMENPSESQQIPRSTAKRRDQFRPHLRIRPPSIWPVAAHTTTSRSLAVQSTLLLRSCQTHGIDSISINRYLPGKH